LLVVYSDEQIAAIVHEANRALQVIQDDIAPSQPWLCEDPDIKANVIVGVRNARHGMTPEEHHDAWCADKRAHGWRWGYEKDLERKTHPCLVPFDQLSSHQQDKNRLFIAIVRALWAGEVPP
jgi:RyR domain